MCAHPMTYLPEDAMPPDLEPISLRPDHESVCILVADVAPLPLRVVPLHLVLEYGPVEGLEEVVLPTAQEQTSDLSIAVSCPA
jgi:hypothetical protein